MCGYSWAMLHQGHRAASVSTTESSWDVSELFVCFHSKGVSSAGVGFVSMMGVND